MNQEVTQATIGTTICVSGWTRTVRPPQQYTSALKRLQIREFGYADRKLGDYEGNWCRWGWVARHMIRVIYGPSHHDSRRLERRREGRTGGGPARLVCSGQVPLAEAQQAIATDWTAAYNRLVVGK
jgi:hypothetical protein